MLMVAIFTTLFTLKGNIVTLNVVTCFQRCGHPTACNKFKFFFNCQTVVHISFN